MHEFILLKAHRLILQLQRELVSTAVVLSLISRYCLLFSLSLNFSNRFVNYIFVCEAGRKGTTSFQDLTLLPCAQRALLCPSLLSTSLCACLLSSAVVYTLPSTWGDGFFLYVFLFFHRALLGLLSHTYRPTPPSASPFSLIRPICRQEASQAWSVHLHVNTPTLLVSQLAPLAFLLSHFDSASSCPSL